MSYVFGVNYDQALAASVENNFVGKLRISLSSLVAGMAQAKGGNRAPFRPGCCATAYFGLQGGCPHPQGFLPSAHAVEQYFFPRTSTDASLQEHVPLLHPGFASFSVAAISTSMRRWSR